MNLSYEEALFARALEKPAEERGVFLDRECAGDTALRQRLENLLRAHEAAGGFLGVNTTEKVPTRHSENPLTEGPGTVIDRYKLLEKLGEGGFSAVCAAEQPLPVKRCDRGEARSAQTANPLRDRRVHPPLEV